MRKLGGEFFKIITSKKGRICAPFFFERVIQEFYRSSLQRCDSMVFYAFFYSFRLIGLR